MSKVLMGMSTKDIKNTKILFVASTLAKLSLNNDVKVNNTLTFDKSEIKYEKVNNTMKDIVNLSMSVLNNINDNDIKLTEIQDMSKYITVNSNRIVFLELLSTFIIHVGFVDNLKYNMDERLMGYDKIDICGAGSILVDSLGDDVDDLESKMWMLASEVVAKIRNEKKKNKGIIK